ncbi:type II CAAX prenyl endopeptidase Rce1 family protein [Pantanalinema rosaneae CENA516]|uniref:CPBP family glutamic-type intramembrane protease n=1 Tax=Pantanalinema rosaneae TaxID=1620701 RepID=UPI003D6F0E5E
MMQKLWWRVLQAWSSRPTKQDWGWAIALLTIYGLVYLPIGLLSGFLRFDPQLSPGTIAQVMVAAVLMPGLNEELMFRVLPIPHPRESISPGIRWFWIGLSWISFLLYHLLPWTPSFFREPMFLLGAGLVGTICTIAYLKTGSLWIPVFIHWQIVVVWLLLLGGLTRFSL